jgi:hypothetical protein
MSVEPAALPVSATPGPELAALAPYYRDRVWTGTIEAGGMGPGSPAMTGTGRARCRLAASGLWYECEFEQDQHLLDGTYVLTWRLHWVAGWDGRAKEYRATSVDNQGPNLGLYRGRIEGDRLVYESADGGLPRIRLSWIPDGPDDCRWRNEFILDGTTWTLIEEYLMTAPEPGV